MIYAEDIRHKSDSAWIAHQHGWITGVFECGLIHISLSIYHITKVINQPVPNLALIELGLSLRATEESVGPSNSRHLDIAPSPRISNARTGPLVMKSTSVL